MKPIFRIQIGRRSNTSAWKFVTVPSSSELWIVDIINISPASSSQITKGKNRKVFNVLSKAFPSGWDGGLMSVWLWWCLRCFHWATLHIFWGKYQERYKFCSFQIKCHFIVKQIHFVKSQNYLKFVFKISQLAHWLIRCSCFHKSCSKSISWLEKQRSWLKLTASNR